MSRSILRCTAVVVFFVLAAAPRADAYSVLAHEALVDACWDDQLAPMLKQRFARTPAAAVRAARAYAYGGSLIQDLGYYPFGSRFFSNLLHYVRSGDFVATLIRDSRDVNEYAFALGALAHYAGDNLGHSTAVNRAVPIVYPKLRAKYGSEVLYADSPARHLMVEFAFGVAQVGRGTFKSDAYQNLIGFEVAKPLLERAFRATYGLDLKDVFGDVDLAIGTYRYAVSRLVPEVTRLAWRDKRDEILAASPGVTEREFVYRVDRRDYEKRYGRTYRKPGAFARFLVTMSKALPKVGPFKPLAFTPLTPQVERMLLEGVAASRARYARLLQAVRAERFSLIDLDLDTGRPPARGKNPLADQTHLDYVKKLAKNRFASR